MKATEVTIITNRYPASLRPESLACVCMRLDKAVEDHCRVASLRSDVGAEPSGRRPLLKRAAAGGSVNSMNSEIANCQPNCRNYHYPRRRLIAGEW